MLQNNTWTETLGKFLLRSGSGLLSLFVYDMTDTKWGQRVLKQIYREGKFTPHPAPKNGKQG